MSSANLLLYIVDESLRREALEALRLSETPVPFDQHDSDWASLLDRIAKTKPEVLLLDLSGVPVELSTESVRSGITSPESKLSRFIRAQIQKLFFGHASGRQ